MSPTEVQCVIRHVREAQAGILQSLYAQLAIRDLIDEPARKTVHDAVMAVCAESACGGFRSDGAA